jgi:hypothetical protein
MLGLLGIFRSRPRQPPRRAVVPAGERGMRVGVARRALMPAGFHCVRSRVGARWRAILFFALEAKSFHAPLAPESLSLACPRESNQREGHPAYALAGLLPGKSAAGLRGLSTAPPVLTPNWPASVPATLRAFLHPPAAAEGSREEQRALLARTRWKAESEASLCSGSSKKYAQDARCSTRGPCAAVRGGRQAPRGIGRDADPFSPGQESGRKTRPTLTDLPPMDGRQAPSGVAFLFGYLSLWPHKEKVIRPPKESESSSLWTTSKATKASRPKSLPPVQTPC